MSAAPLPSRPTPVATAVQALAPYRQFICHACGWIYDEAEGAPDDGIPPGTRWDDLPLNWVCPECGARKDDFEMIEI